MARQAAGTTAFQELGRRSLSRDAAEQLKRAILDGALVPGDRLPPERELAARFGVSRPTLRGAVNALVIMGLLESRHGSGTFVAAGAVAPAPSGEATAITVEMGDSPLVALFELRLLFEPAAAQRAAARIKPAQLQELERLLAELEASVDNAGEFVRIDTEFHNVIQKAAQSAEIASVLDAISELALRGRTLSASHRRVRERMLGEHAAILRALERRDPFAAAAAMTAHLMHMRATMAGRPA